MLKKVFAFSQLLLHAITLVFIAYFCYSLFTKDVLEIPMQGNRYLTLLCACIGLCLQYIVRALYDIIKGIKNNEV